MDDRSDGGTRTSPLFCRRCSTGWQGRASKCRSCGRECLRRTPSRPSAQRARAAPLNEKKVNVGTVLGLATRHRAEHVRVLYSRPLQIGFVLLQSAYGFLACHKFTVANSGISPLSFSSSSSVKGASAPPFHYWTLSAFDGTAAKTGTNDGRPH